MERVRVHRASLGAGEQAPESRRPAGHSQRAQDVGGHGSPFPTLCGRGLALQRALLAPSAPRGPGRAASVPVLSSLVLLGQGPSCPAQGSGCRAEVQTLRGPPALRLSSWRFLPTSQEREPGIGGGAQPPSEDLLAPPQTNGSATHLYVFLGPPAIPVVQAAVFCHPGAPGGHPGQGAGLRASAAPPADCPSRSGQPPPGRGSQPAPYQPAAALG